VGLGRTGLIHDETSKETTMIFWVYLRGCPVMVYAVETQAEAEQGLMNQVIDDDEALLLPADTGLHTVNVPHAIDIVWVKNDGSTIAIDENVPPGMIVQSKGPFAIELRGGWFQRHPPQPLDQTTQPCCDGCSDRAKERERNRNQVTGQHLAERHALALRGAPAQQHAMQLASGPHMGGAPHGGGGGHPHGGGGHYHHGGGWGSWGGFWPWWDYYGCDPCDPQCPDYDPTLPACQ
jgi:uncharacterized membrane protein (UPF0127 family)